jgi:hypothetical protein
MFDAVTETVLELMMKVFGGGSGWSKWGWQKLAVEVLTVEVGRKQDRVSSS